LDTVHERLARLRFGAGRVELIASLDELRERIAQHLSTDPVADVPALAEPRVDVATALRPASAQTYPELTGRTILVIDDDIRNVFAISSVLGLYRLNVIHAPDGRRGIDTLRAADNVDLILMDVMMPEMDGYATTTAIRRIPQFATLPIIAVTAKAMHGDREKCLAAGVTDYVTKPVDTDELLSVMSRQFPAR
ncbi:MAG: response regulator, partial [Frankia sp.]